MKFITLLFVACIVAYSCVDVQGQTTSGSAPSGTTGSAVSTGSGVPKTVRISNLQYTAVRRIRKNSSSTSTTSSGLTIRSRRNRARRARKIKLNRRNKK